DREEGAAGRRGLVARGGQAEDRAEGRPDARRPPEGEGDAEQRGAEQAGPGHAVDAYVAVDEGDPAEGAGQHEAEQDGHHAEAPGQRLLVLPQGPAEGAEEGAERHEDDRDAEHEPERAEGHPPGPGAAALAEVAHRGAGHVRQVAGDERQDARRQERHDPGRGRDGRRHQQRPVPDLVGGLGGGRGEHPGGPDAPSPRAAASAAVTSSPVRSTAPGRVAVTAPSRSSTTVVGPPGAPKARLTSLRRSRHNVVVRSCSSTLASTAPPASEASRLTATTSTPSAAGDSANSCRPARTSSHSVHQAAQLTSSAGRPARSATDTSSPVTRSTAS